jgi:hypothetical protein
MASFREGSDYCEHCDRDVIVRQEQPNHVLHLLLSLFCCGWWVFVWILLTLSASSNPWRCSRCGRAVPHRSKSSLLVVLILVAFGVVLTFVVGGCVLATLNNRPHPALRESAKAKVVVDANKVDGRPDDANPVRERGPVPHPFKGEAGQVLEPSVDPTPARKEVYVRIHAALVEVEKAAIKKFSRPPKDSDAASFKVPYQAFVDQETEKALTALAKELGLPRKDLDGIRSEGDREGWPRR